MIERQKQTFEKLRDRSIPNRREKRLEQLREEDTIRFALKANSATNACRRDDDEQ